MFLRKLKDNGEKVFMDPEIEALLEYGHENFAFLVK